MPPTLDGVAVVGAAVVLVAPDATVELAPLEAVESEDPQAAMARTATATVARVRVRLLVIFTAYSAVV